MTEAERAQIRRERMLEANAQKRRPTDQQARNTAAGKRGKESSPYWQIALVPKAKGGMDARAKS